MRDDNTPLIPMRWPLPAVLAWGACWVTYLIALRLNLSGADAAALAAMLGLLLSLKAATAWRRLWVVLGFPASLLLLGLSQADHQGAGQGTGGFPAWLWLLPAAALMLVYPLRAWRDAPLFPTPPDALNELPAHAPLEPQARVLDAGCGLGQGLEALRQAYPLARLEGIEWSRPLAWWCARRCPWAQIGRGDLWRSDWSRYELVYMFQRPESMPQALDKARRELRKDSWFVSLEFELPGVRPHAQLATSSGKPIWVYAGETLKTDDEPTPDRDPH